MDTIRFLSFDNKTVAVGAINNFQRHCLPSSKANHIGGTKANIENNGVNTIVRKLFLENICLAFYWKGEKVENCTEKIIELFFKRSVWDADRRFLFSVIVEGFEESWHHNNNSFRRPMHS
jgi:hypothetical protein